MARRLPVSLLNSVDLPVLGRPIMATMPLGDANESSCLARPRGRRRTVATRLTAPEK